MRRGAGKARWRQRRGRGRATGAEAPGTPVPAKQRRLQLLDQMRRADPGSPRHHPQAAPKQARRIFSKCANMGTSAMCRQAGQQEDQTSAASFTQLKRERRETIAARLTALNGPERAAIAGIHFVRIRCQGKLRRDRDLERVEGSGFPKHRAFRAAGRREGAARRTISQGAAANARGGGPFRISNKDRLGKRRYTSVRPKHKAAGRLATREQGKTADNDGARPLFRRAGASRRQNPRHHDKHQTSTCGRGGGGGA